MVGGSRVLRARAARVRRDADSTVPVGAHDAANHRAAARFAGERYSLRRPLPKIYQSAIPVGNPGKILATLSSGALY
jgi:hypothetical protein